MNYLLSPVSRSLYLLKAYLIQEKRLRFPLFGSTRPHISISICSATTSKRVKRDAEKGVGSELAPLSWTPRKGDNSPREVSDGETATIHQRVQTRGDPALEILGTPGRRGGP